MSNIDPEILARAKRDCGENCALEKLTEWSYTFKCGPKSFCRISRFMVQDRQTVNAAALAAFGHAHAKARATVGRYPTD